ncbi:hypothetical protein [Mucilaginibacter gracilis]|uniref:hypothetical protein n=1 Tax=Mucilaginibacter gracilis TaxID=423350 RepID=UPI0013C32813|nr:hypothetical protein [Mucilaginibacter gracilis]
MNNSKTHRFGNFGFNLFFNFPASITGGIRHYCDKVKTPKQRVCRGFIFMREGLQ